MSYDYMTALKRKRDTLISTAKRYNLELHELQTKSAVDFDESDHKRIIELNKRLGKCEKAIEDFNRKLEA